MRRAAAAREAVGSRATASRSRPTRWRCAWARDALDGQVDPTALVAALTLLEGTRVPPLHALGADAGAGRPTAQAPRPNPSAAAWRARMQVTAQALADSLRQDLPLQAGFIRKHRDLLT